MPKKIPMRMCVGCREMHEKRELIRIVKSAEGMVSIDMREKRRDAARISAGKATALSVR